MEENELNELMRIAAKNPERAKMCIFWLIQIIKEQDETIKNLEKEVKQK